MNYASLYLLGVMISFVVFLTLVKRGESVKKYGAFMVALACLLMALVFPISWALVVASLYLEKES